MRHLAQNQKGFTLLEVMISFALIVVVVFVTVITQSGSASSATRNRNILIATNLARNLINEQELKYEGIDFTRLPKTETKNFPEPNDKIKWTITYEEVDFSALTDLLQKQADKENEKNGGGSNDSNAGQTQMLMRIFKDYMQKSVRRMNVTIEWPEGNGTSTQTFSELLVNYDQDFNLGA